jgi:hypothetical protein
MQRHSILRLACLSLTLATASAAAASLAACGDDEHVTPDGGATPDAPLAGPDAGPTGCACFVAAVDYANMTGAGAVVHVPALTVEKNVAAGAVSGDPVVRLDGTRLLIVNRFGYDNVTVLGAADRSLVTQFSVGSDFNPQDAALHGHFVYVVGLGAGEVRVFDLDDTAAAPTKIPLPTIAADVDGNPDGSSIVIVGDTAYVVLQHLENFMPAAAGQVAVIDTTTNTVTSTVDLDGQNPSGFARRAADDSLLVGLTPNYDPAMGCLDEVATGATPAASCVIDSATLGGYVTGLAPLSDGTAAVAVAQSFTAGTLELVDLAGGAPTPISTAGEQPIDVAACEIPGHTWLVAADGTAAGVRVYQLGATPSELTTAALDVGLPPAFASGIACVPE